MIPGLNSNLITKDKEKESANKIQRFLTAMDSMTKDELDGVKTLDPNRVKRIARGAGVHISEVEFLIAQHKQFGTMVKSVGSLANLGGAGGNFDQEMKRNPQAAMQKMKKNVDPKLINSMGGMGNIMDMAKSMGMGGPGGAGGAGGMPDMGQAMKMMQGMMGGGGGGGGMPDMGKMM